MTAPILLFPRHQTGKVITGRFPARLPSRAGTVTAQSGQQPRQRQPIPLWKYRVSGGDAA